MAKFSLHPAIAIGLFPWFRDVRNSKTIILTGLASPPCLTLMSSASMRASPIIICWGTAGPTPCFLPQIHRRTFAWNFFNISRIKISDLAVWLYLFASMASHGLIDALTNGGLGIAFFAPFSNERFFFSYRPIEVSTLNIRHFLKVRARACWPMNLSISGRLPHHCAAWLFLVQKNAA